METFDTYFGKAIQCYQDNNLKLAIHNFSKCLEIEPENYAVYNNRGLMYYNIDNFEMAIQDFNNSLRLNSNNLDSYYNRGLAYQQFGNYDKALKDFNIVKTNSLDFNNLETEIQKTLDLKSGNSISLNLLANFAHDGGDPEVAFNGGKFFFDNNNFQSAINSFTNALNYQPDFVDAYLYRARCYSNLMLFDKAIDDYILADNYIEHKDVTKANIGNVYAQMGQFEISLEYLNKAVELDPYNYLNYYYRGLTKAKMNKIDSSVFDLTKALEIRPDDIDCLYQRAVINFNNNNYSLAKIDLQLLISLQSDNSTYHYIMGLLYFTQDDKINSLKYLTKSQNLGDNNAKDFIKQNFRI